MKPEQQHKIDNSTVFFSFKKIPDKAFHDYYYFYQYYFEQISNLNFEEYMEIKFNYIRALYHLDKYSLFYRQADELLLELLNAPYFESHHRACMEQILALKAAAYRNENKMESAIQLYEEVYKMNPRQKAIRKKFRYLLFQREQFRNQNQFAVLVVVLVLSLLVTGLQLFVADPFFPIWSEPIRYFRNVLFLGAIAGFAAMQYRHWYRANRHLTEINQEDRQTRAGAEEP
ncbi:MAG TPA: hypothetical protein VFX48_06975 [Saprospiraceae bacterium]|nr:hypothetical protein [Saprospiraceae bacterium]